MDKKPLALRVSTVAVTALVALIGSVALAVDTAAIDTQVAATLKQFYALSDKNKSLADGAAGVLVFPSITKGGIGIAGEHGEGALLQKGKTVGYYSVSGASIGLTLGVAKHSQVILFQTQQALDKFLGSSNWSAGADASVAVVYFVAILLIFAPCREASPISPFSPNTKARMGLLSVCVS